MWIDANKQKPLTKKPVLIAYTVSDHNIPAITMGWYTPSKTVESDSFEGEVDDEYDEENDRYYMKEQWVDESNESEYHYSISNVSHWMPLPDHPDKC